MKISYLSSAAAVLALALTQTSGAGILTLNGSNEGTISGVSINSAGDMVVTTGAPPPPPPPGTPVCNLGANPLSIAPGGSSGLTASCSPGPITNYAWTVTNNGPTASGLGGTLPFPSVGSFTYSVLATNASGPGNSSNSVTINVATPPPPGSCPAIPAGTTLTNYNVVWSPKGGTPKKLYPIKRDEIAALKFTADGPISTRYGYLSWVPNTSVASKPVIINISRCPGDFTQPDASASNPTYLCRGEGATSRVNYTQAGIYSALSLQCIIGTGDYYINIRNGERASGSVRDPSYPITDTCPAGGTQCGVTVTFY